MIAFLNLKLVKKRLNLGNLLLSNEQFCSLNISYP